MKRSSINLFIAGALISLGVVLRLLPHPANFAPVTAIAIFGGAVLPRRLALWAPLAIMMFSDSIIGFHKLVPVTWGCFALVALVSNLWLKKPNLVRGATLTLSASVFFFVVTNFAVWLFDGMYAHSWSGLSQCFTLALPFFRNTLLSDVVYTSGLFSLYALAVHYSSRVLVSYGLELKN